MQEQRTQLRSRAHMLTSALQLRKEELRKLRERQAQVTYPTYSRRTASAFPRPIHANSLHPAVVLSAGLTSIPCWVCCALPSQIPSAHLSRSSKGFQGGDWAEFWSGVPAQAVSLDEEDLAREFSGAVRLTVHVQEEVTLTPEQASPGSNSLLHAPCLVC